MTTQLIYGDCLAVLATLPARSVRCCVTSPPYYGLRDYGHDGQIGLEDSPEAYVSRLAEVFRQVRRVLTDDGTLWLNLGDSYAMHTRGKGGDGKQATNRGSLLADLSARVPADLKPKDLIGIPWRVAFALQADGWYLRSDCIWHKPNPMPESVRDRPTKAHEYLFLLAKSRRYYYDADAVREPLEGDGRARGGFGGKQAGVNGNHTYSGKVWQDSPAGRNKRDVWTIPTRPYKGAHFAVMPEALVEPCVLAGSAPGDAVLDPFCGSGTVGAVALHHGRRFVGIDLNADYLALARARIAAAQPPLPLDAAAD